MKIILLAVLSLPVAAPAAEQRIECPARYPAADVMLPETGKWATGRVLGRRPLEGGGMLIGPLEQQGELRGSDERIKDGFRTSFGFNPEQDPPGKWFLCYYGRDGSVQLAQRVTDTATSCTLTHKTKKFPLEPDVWITCR